MSTSLLSIGMTGLNAAQAGILTTGNNIANAATPGYNREQIVQSTAIPNLTGGGFIGQGTNVQTVTRSYSQYLNTQLLSAQSGASSLTSYGTQIAQIDNMLADPTAGLSPALANFFQGVQQATANPASIPSRQAMLSNAQSLVASFQNINQTLQGIRDGTNTQIGGEVTLINSYASQLAAVNQQIVLAQGTSNSQPANDLLDQRDQLISNLNKEIGVTTVVQSDGTYNVFIGNGQPLVVGSQASTLTTTQDPNDPQKTAVAFQVPGGKSAILSDSLLSGGTLGGLVSFRDNSLDPAQNQLGLIAIGLATSFNAQSQLGQDLNGNLGGQFFSVTAPAVFANGQNTGSGSVTATISDVSKLTASDYRLTVTGGGNYSLLRLSDNTVTTYSSLPISADGLSINVSGTPANGDSFLIQPTRTGAANIAVSLTDPAAIALAVPISTAAAQANSGTATISPGVVSATATTLAAPFTVTYQTSPSTGFTGFPVGSTVSVGGTNYQITSPTMSVPYTSGTISVDGVGVSITGTPASGDSFTVTPPALSDGTSVFFATTATPASAAVVGSAAPALPLTSSTNEFVLTLDGVSKTITVPAGTPAGTLVTAVQLLADTAFGAGKATVSADSSHLVITNSTAGGTISLGQVTGNTGLASLFGNGPTGQITGSTAIAAPPTTTTINAGKNDSFPISTNGGPAQWVTLPAGSYTQSQLATQIQTSINAAVSPPGVTVSVDGSNHLVITSKLGSAANSSVAVGAMIPSQQSTPSQAGLAAMFGTTGTAKAAIAGVTAPLIINSSNDTFSIALDAVVGGPQTIKITDKTYATAADLAVAIQSAINSNATFLAATPPASATVSVDSSGKLVVTSNNTTVAGAVVITPGSVLFGTTTSSAGVIGSLALANPVNIVTGLNDKFTIQVDSGPSQWVTIPAGSYTPSALASQLQTSLGNGVAVGLSDSNQLVVTSDTGGPVVLGSSNLGGGTIVAATAASSSSLPAAPIALTYNNDDPTNFPNGYLSGFPVGAIVTVNTTPPTNTPIALPSTRVAYTSGATLSFNGISFAISGAPNTGDTFTVGPNANGVSDSRNGLLLGQLQTAKILESTGSGGPSASLQDAYSQIVSEVGNKAREVQVTGAAQTSLATQAQTARDSFSAVNLDEEAANLIQYQQAYQASAKMITIAGKLFDSILGI